MTVYSNDGLIVYHKIFINNVFGIDIDIDLGVLDSDPLFIIVY